MKTRTKRWISAGLVATLVIAALQFIPNLPRTSHAEGEEVTSQRVIREVIDEIEQLPQYGDPQKMAMDYGSADRPFVVLEIVPYYEYAEFGYMIGGCEPIAVETLEATTMANVTDTLKTLGTCDLMDFKGNIIYFQDEPEYEQNKNTPGFNTGAGYNVGDGVYGYYELVDDGQGAFRYTNPKPDTVTDGNQSGSSDTDTVTDGDMNQDGESQDDTQPPVDDVIYDSTIEYVGSGGNLKWHTIIEMSYVHESWSPVYERFTLAEYKNMCSLDDFEADIDKAIRESDLRDIGDRLYTKRKMEFDNNGPICDALISWNSAYNEYSNRELFLKNSVLPGASDEQIANFSVVVKTITPAELSTRPEWIDYADLISIAPKMHGGDDNYVQLWKQYKRSNRESNVTAYVKNFEGERDLSWECALKIYQKVTADENYAALVLDDNGYNTVPQPTSNITIDIYNWNLEKNKTYSTYDHSGSNNNYYKLYSMLFCMDSYFFKQIYLNGYEEGKALIYEENGVAKLRLQNGAAAEYWCLESFLLMPDDANTHPYAYWTTDAMWENYTYATCSIATTRKGWCNDHVYAYDGDSSLAMGYVKMDTLTDLDKFPDFAGSLEIDGAQPRTAEAIQYILGKRSNPNDQSYGKDSTLRILDLEPSVDLYDDGQGTPKYYLQPSYITMLLPNFRGSVSVTHQTTAEFIGKIEDLNTTYQMIYMGLDFSAYNTKEVVIGKDQWGNDVYGQLPDWNDDSKDGKIYLHTGDSMISTEIEWNKRRRSVKWLLQDNGSTLDSTELRFPGNDISYLKKQDLQNYLDAGYPVIADAFLYNLDSLRIDPTSYVYSLINENKAKGNLFSTGSRTSDVEDAIRKILQSAVTFDSWPAEYNGSTNGVDSPVVSNPNYLPSNNLGFNFTVNPLNSNDRYRYRLYVDQDKDSKFSAGEIVYDNTASNGANSYNYRISSSWLGLIQWKLEVYQIDASGAATGIRYSKIGRSAVKNDGAKKEINVLQITPDDGGNLNLSDPDSGFPKYYTQLQDYVIHVDTITWKEFEKYFYTGNKDDGTAQTKGFYYDYTKSLSDDPSNPNPGNLGELSEELLEYNMLIMGFGDTYGGTNLSNEFGAVDYIRYHVDQGKSILFTHDLSSMLNVGSGDYGYTVNALMRDLMGMNRYGSVSAQADNARNRSNPTLESTMLKTYQSTNASKYDWIDSSAIHGYTYYTLKRLGFNAYDPAGLGCKIPYKYMIKNTKGQDYTDSERFGLGSGFNNTNDETTRVSMANEGQVTTYPYLIGEGLSVANTHAQWYSLSPEDPNVTVWYCLAGDPQNIDISDGNKGMSTTYAVSPNDAMNNYYIYSKNNIFYSGVGHTPINGEMEIKLFINTMIAAYNAGYVPPVIEVTNTEAYTKGILRYAIELMQSYDFEIDDAGNFRQTVEVFESGDTYPVNFTPIDMNLISTNFESSIWYDLGKVDASGKPIYTYVQQVVELDGENGKPVMVNGSPKTLYADPVTHIFTGANSLENGKYYRLYYPMSNMSEDVHDTYFWIRNPDKDMENTTKLEMDVLPLFPLD